MSKILTDAEHHAKAAEHHEQAALHHRRASRHYLEKEFAYAAHQALIAHGHTQQAIRHGDGATRYHVEHHDKEPPRQPGACAARKESSSANRGPP